jgi:flagellar motor protein MotB
MLEESERVDRLAAMGKMSAAIAHQLRTPLSKEVDIKRIAEVLGYGDSVPSLPNDPTNPLNRRISITVLPKPDNASPPR